MNEYGTYDEDDEEQVDNEDTITSDAKFENEDKLVKEDDVVAKTKEVNTATTSLPTENKLSSLSLSTNGRSKLYSREELIHYFKTVHKGRKVQDNVTTIGLVGDIEYQRDL